MEGSTLERRHGEDRRVGERRTDMISDQDRIEELEKALNFYARRANWWGPVPYSSSVLSRKSVSSPAHIDCGKIAREALGWEKSDA